jgi:hypothetical protein
LSKAGVRMDEPTIGKDTDVQLLWARQADEHIARN